MNRRTTNQQMFRTKNSGLSLVELLIGVIIAIAALFATFKLIGWSNQIFHSYSGKADISSIRALILRRISCAETRKAWPASNNCPSYSNILDRNGQIFISSTGTKFGHWTVVGRCSGGLITVEAAHLKDGANVFSTGSAAFRTDPHTKSLLAWNSKTTRLFPEDTSPCDTPPKIVLRRPAIYKVPGSYTYTVPYGVYNILVEVWGGGGGGGSGTGHGGSAGGSGGSGGAGGYVRAFLAVNPFDSFNLVVARGGNGAAAGGRGQDGASSQFGGIITAEGGKGGERNNLNLYGIAYGGEGGFGSGPSGSLVFKGGYGEREGEWSAALTRLGGFSPFGGTGINSPGGGGEGGVMLGYPAWSVGYKGGDGMVMITPY